MPLPDASKKSPRVYTLLQNTDLDNVTFDNVQAVGNPIAIEEANLVNLCRLVTSGEWTGLLEAGGGSDAPVFAPFASPEYGTGTGLSSFSPTCPIAPGYTSSYTLDSNYYTPSHFPFYSSDYTEVDEYSITFTGTAGDAGSTGSLAIYTLSTADDAGWVVGRPMAKVANSEVSYATDTSGTVEVSPASTVTLEAKRWYSIAVVADDAYTQFPKINRATEIAQFWGDENWGGLTADGETDYTLPASYTTSTTWSSSQLTYYIPRLQWRGTN